MSAPQAFAQLDEPAITGATYYSVGPLPAQDGANVWRIVRCLEGSSRQLCIAEYMNEHAATRAMNDLNAAAARAARLAV